METGMARGALPVGPAPRKRSHSAWLGLATLTLALALAVGSPAPARAGSGEINDLIAGGKTAGKAPATPLRPNEVAPGRRPGKDELWLKTGPAIAHLHLITSRPHGGETCPDVIFNRRPALKARIALKEGEAKRVSLEQLCLLGFRNGSEERALVVRLGDAFDSLAMVSNQRLFTGFPLAPGEQVAVALRRSPQAPLEVSLEVVWQDQLDAAAPEVDKAALLFVAGAKALEKQ